MRGGAILLACLALLLPATVQACVQGPEAAAVRGSDIPGAATWFEDATAIYGHDIMGAVPDATTLVVLDHALTGGPCGVDTRRITAGPDHVFEDIAPRLADVTGDGLPEVVTVRSSLTQGAQLVIYGGADGELRLLAATPYIGRRNRWLAPAAIGDLDGDGAVEVAFVDRPHLAKTLRIWRYSGESLREIAAVSGVTNHAIGEEVIHGGLRDCGAGPEIVLSDGGRDRLLALTLTGGEISARDIGRFTAETARAALACAG